MPDLRATPSRSVPSPTTVRAAAVRVSLAPLGTPRAAELLAELTQIGSPVPEVVLDPANTVTGVLVILHDVETSRAAAGGVYTVRDDDTIELVGAWCPDTATPGLSRRVVWELEAEARRRGFSQAVATSPLDEAQLEVLAAAGYTTARRDADGEPARGKSLVRR